MSSYSKPWLHTEVTPKISQINNPARQLCKAEGDLPEGSGDVEHGENDLKLDDEPEGKDAKLDEEQRSEMTRLFGEPLVRES